MRTLKHREVKSPAQGHTAEVPTFNHCLALPVSTTQSTGIGAGKGLSFIARHMDRLCDLGQTFLRLPYCKIKILTLKV